MRVHSLDLTRILTSRYHPEDRELFIEKAPAAGSERTFYPTGGWRHDNCARPPIVGPTRKVTVRERWLAARSSPICVAGPDWMAAHNFDHGRAMSQGRTS
jgi:hypothetical protein